MRYCPGQAFPPYAFLPGRDPHPSRDPAGHSFGKAERDSPWLPAAEWRSNGPYLFGVDLYNAGFLWEAHEAWEGIWIASRGDPLQANYLQGLIQCAAACLKIPMEQPRGLRLLGELGTARLRAARERAGARFMGLTIDSFVDPFTHFMLSEPGKIDGRPLLELEWDPDEHPLSP